MAHATFVLVHRPLVGPSTWQPVADELRSRGHTAVVPDVAGLGWRDCVATVAAECGAIPGPLVVAGHSGAGPLLPAVAEPHRARVDAIVFVEAGLPPLSGAAELAPSWLLDHLRRIAVEDRLPPWSRWWGPDALADLVPDPAQRAALDADMPELSLRYFDQRVPVPAGWARGAGPSYLWFSDVYADDAAEAERRGWPVRRVPGSHLHLVVVPTTIADAIVSLGRARPPRGTSGRRRQGR